MKSADKIFAKMMINAGLTTDGRIHLRQQRCRYLHNGNAAQINGGGKTGQVTDNTAAQSRHPAVSSDIGLNHLSKYGAEYFHVFFVARRPLIIILVVARPASFSLPHNASP